MSNSRDQIIKKARKLAKAKNAWRKEFVVWLCVSILLMMINAFSGGEPWFQWAVIPWGIVMVMRRLLLWSQMREDKTEQKEIRRALKRSGLEPELYEEEIVYAEDDVDHTDSDQLELDDIPEPEEELVPKKRWDDRDFV